MKFIKDTDWQQVFEGWRDREGSNPEWVECATKVKGWPDWESWRSFTAQQIDAENRIWKIFQFENPIEEIPKILVGPYSGWQSRVINKNNTSFAELLEIPVQYEDWLKNPRLLKIMAGLPFATEMIGLVIKDVDKIVCLDGHHRATAVTLAKKQGKNVDFSKTPVTIALTELVVDHSQLLDNLLKRGTSKNPDV